MRVSRVSLKCRELPRTFSRDAGTVSSPMFLDRGRRTLHLSPYPAMGFQPAVVGLHRPEFIGQHDEPDPTRVPLDRKTKPLRMG